MVPEEGSPWFKALCSPILLCRIWKFLSIYQHSTVIQLLYEFLKYIMWRQWGYMSPVIDRVVPPLYTLATIQSPGCPNSVHMRGKMRQIRANWWGSKISWKTYLRRVFRFWTYSWDLAQSAWKADALPAEISPQ